MTGFRTGPGDAVRAGHPGTALLPGCPEIQVVLMQQPQQLPAQRIQLLLQLRMRQATRLRPRQPLLQLREARPGPGKLLTA